MVEARMHNFISSYYVYFSSSKLNQLIYFRIYSTNSPLSVLIHIIIHSFWPSSLEGFTLALVVFRGQMTFLIMQKLKSRFAINFEQVECIYFCDKLLVESLRTLKINSVYSPNNYQPRRLDLTLSALGCHKFFHLQRITMVMIYKSRRQEQIKRLQW